MPDIPDEKLRKIEVFRRAARRLITESRRQYDRWMAEHMLNETPTPDHDVFNLTRRAEAAEAELAKANARIAELERALKPFVDAALEIAKATSPGKA